jgi:uncharacterized protein (TIGR03086 family)
MSRDADGGLRGHAAVPPSGTAAFEWALRYALVAAGHATPELMDRPTPCRAWDLRMLLLHATDSLAALAEGLDDGRVLLHSEAAAADPRVLLHPEAAAADPAVLFRWRARRLLGSCSRADLADGVITVGGCPMAAMVLVTAGALEIAVHGWDVAQACGSREPIPAPLAAGLLRAAPLLVTDLDRRHLFAAPVRVTAAASPSDRLTAFLGRPALWSALSGGVHVEA